MTAEVAAGPAGPPLGAVVLQASSQGVAQG